MTLVSGSPAVPTFVPQVCLAVGAEAGSQARAEVSQKRSQAGRQANSEPALRPPETELPEAMYLLQSMSLQDGKKRQVLEETHHHHLCNL